MLRTLSAPAGYPITLPELKDHLRVLTEDDDLYIEAMIPGLTAAAELATGRALITRSLQLLLPGFTDTMALPMPPVSAVSQVQYRDVTGALQVLDPPQYETVADINLPMVALAPACVWPVTYARFDAVQITYTAGYGSTPDDVPGGIRDWMKVRAAERYEYREPVIVGSIVNSLDYVDRLLDPYRVPRGF